MKTVYKYIYINKYSWFKELLTFLYQSTSVVRCIEKLIIWRMELGASINDLVENEILQLVSTDPLIFISCIGSVFLKSIVENSEIPRIYANNK